MDGKRFALVMAACLLIIVVWSRLGDKLFGPLEQPKTAPPVPTSSDQQRDSDTSAQKSQPSPRDQYKTDSTGQAQDKTVPSTTQLQTSGDQIARAAVKQIYQLQDDIYLGSKDRGSGYKLQLRLTSDGAAIAQAWLTEFAGDSDEYKYSESSYGQGRKTPLTILYPVAGRYKPPNDNLSQPPCRLSLATSRIQFLRPKAEQAEPGQRVLDSIDLVQDQAQSGQAHWRLVEQNSDAEKSWSTFQTAIKFQRLLTAPAELTLLKTYILRKDSYDVQVQLELKSSADSPDNLALAIVQDGPTGIPRDDSGTDTRAGVLSVLTPGKIRVQGEPYATIVDEKKDRGLIASDPSKGDLLWAGVMNKFFAAILVPSSKLADPKDSTAPNPGQIFGRAEVLPIVDPATNRPGNVLTRLVADYIELQPGQSKSLKVNLFLGPKDRRLLSSGQYGRLNFVDSIQYQSCASLTIFAPISIVMLWLLDWIYWLIPNYGVGIILLVIAVRAALHHFTRTSQVSMMRMQKLAPELEKLKQKYGNNRDEMGKAQMALYKEHKINPISGCLPMLLQMPIWLALYSALNSSVNLRHAPFFWWINNLSGADNITAYFAGRLPAVPLINLPLLGPIWGLNVLPILSGIAMFLQQRFTPSPGAAASPQAQQTKMMMYMMPILFPLMLYGAPSGLNLYIMTSTFVGLIENHYIKQHIRRQEEAQNSPAAGTANGKIKTLRLK